MRTYSCTRISFGRADFLMESIVNPWGEDDPIVPTMIDSSYDEPISLTFWSKLSEHASDGSVFLDVGAFSGLYSIVAAIENKKIKVIAFEPSSVTFGRLARNLLLNELDVRVIPANLAVGRNERALVFPHRYGVHTLCPGEGLAGQDVDHTQPASCVPLDALLQSPASLHYIASKSMAFLPLGRVRAIKIDVEGAERDVLEGARALIETHRPVIIAEILSTAAAEELIDFSKSVRYRAVSVPSERNLVLLPDEDLEAAALLRDSLERPAAVAAVRVIGWAPSEALRTPGPGLGAFGGLAATSPAEANGPQLSSVQAVPHASPSRSLSTVTLGAALRSVVPATPAAVEAVLASLPEAYRARVAMRVQDLQGLRERGSLPGELLQSEWLIDWECGDCAFAIALLLCGAKRVMAADSWLDEGRLPSGLLAMPGLVTAKLDIAGVAAAFADAGIVADLVFANTVTEHIQDLPAAFTAIRRSLRPGGYFFTNHDNYYQPVGSHDHGFLFYGPNNEIVFQGVRCWEKAEKCAASDEHRARIARDLPWTLTREQDATRNPTNCDKCFYFRRAQPWAHLLNQAEFRTYFGSETFTTGRPQSGLNKVTLFQLRQLIVEAGMELVRFDRHLIVNEPPAELLAPPFCFSRDELETSTAAILARAP